MKKWFFGILAALFLLGSFPERNYCGTMVSDMMRLLGFVFIVILTVVRLRQREK